MSTTLLECGFHGVLVWPRSHKKPRPIAQIIMAFIFTPGPQSFPQRPTCYQGKKNGLRSIRLFSAGPCLCPCLGHRVFVGCRSGPTRNHNQLGTGPLLASRETGQRSYRKLQAVGGGIRTLEVPLERWCSGNRFHRASSMCFWLVYGIGHRRRGRQKRAGDAARARICRKGWEV